MNLARIYTSHRKSYIDANNTPLSVRAYTPNVCFHFYAQNKSNGFFDSRLTSLIQLQLRKSYSNLAADKSTGTGKSMLPRFCEYEVKKLRCPACSRQENAIFPGEKPFKCTLCDISFLSLNSLRQHKRGVHKIQGPKGGVLGWGNYKNKSKNKEHKMPHPS